MSSMLSIFPQKNMQEIDSCMSVSYYVNFRTGWRITVFHFSGGTRRASER